MPRKQAKPLPQTPTIEDTSFFELLEIDPELAEARQHYAAESPKRRRAAANWSYDSGVTADALPPSWLCDRGETPRRPPWWPCVVALAIDPMHAPALLGVGSIEYQCGRKAEAMKLFLTLTTLPEDTEDLSAIIDEAGDFLLGREDWDNAHRLFAEAAQAYPRVGLYPDGMGYCLAKQGRLAEAIERHRKAVALEPESPQYWNDLGWSLVEAKQYDEAQTALERAVAMSPPDYDRARNSLRELRRRMELAGTAGAKRGQPQPPGS